LVFVCLDSAEQTLQFFHVQIAVRVESIERVLADHALLCRRLLVVQLDRDTDLFERHLLPDRVEFRLLLASSGVFSALLIHVLLPAQERKDVLVCLLVLRDLAAHQRPPLCLRQRQHLLHLLLFLLHHVVTPVGRVPLEAGVVGTLVVVRNHQLRVDLLGAVSAHRLGHELAEYVDRAIDLCAVRLLAVSNRCALGHPVGLAELAALERLVQDITLGTHHDTAGDEHHSY